ncbi:MAG: response regulator [Scytolyngbya sp. HA4215-MV1]|jgi:signal transduction histidine kinase|nr:response regulator [Scytolyngbya sp. HA4215-MV1]
MNILVIEDEKEIRQNILGILESGGFHTISANAGQIGLQIAKEQLPDLILCDIKMPEFDGYDVLTKVRQDPATANIPFIFLTAKAEHQEIRIGMNLGADDYLIKPFRRQELLEAVSARLTRQNHFAHFHQEIQELRELCLLKDDFFCEISHDLRAPLGNIRLALQLLQSIPHDQDRQRYIDVALSACEDSCQLVQNLLDWQRLVMGEIIFNLETLDLPPYLSNFINSFLIRAQNEQQILRFEILEPLPRLVSDPINLRRVLTELLNNACKYTAKGGEIIFRVYATTTADSGSAITFLIRNQAEISQLDLPYIFERFYRVNGERRAMKEGSGLGLAIVKKLIEQLRGNLHVKSEKGWTEFSIELPTEPLGIQHLASFT